MKNSRLMKAVAAITLSAVSVAAGLGTAGCAHKHTFDEQWEKSATHHWHAATCEHTDQKSAYGEHVWGGDSECDVCHYVKGEEKPDPKPELTHKDYVKPDADDVNDNPSVAVYDDEQGVAEAVPAPKVIANTGNGEALEEGNIETAYEFDAAKLSTTKYADGWTDGVFSIAAGTEVRGRIKTGLYENGVCVDPAYVTVNSVKLGDSSSALTVKISAAGTLMFYVQNGSGGVGSAEAPAMQTVVLTKPDGSTQDINYQAMGGSSNIERVTLQLATAGTYTIKRKSGTSDIFYAKFSNTVSNTPINAINMANTGTVDYIVGQQLDCTGIAVTATHAETGRISPVKAEKLVLDTSKYDATTPGTYEIGVAYTVDGNLGSAETTFTTKYNVNVYSFEDLTVGFNRVVKENKNSAAGNGVYANHAVKQFYFKDGAFSADGLSIKATGKLGDKTKVFSLDEAQAEITGNSTATAGKKAVKVAYTANGLTKAKGFNIYVAEKGAELATADEVIVAVNPEFSTATIGTKNSAGAYRFKTIQQAVDFLNGAGIKDGAEKKVYIAEGTYWEKLEITVPNVTLIGAGQDRTKIEYDSLYGVADEGGFVHTTDSTATLNVRDTAVGFEMRGVTVANKYNTLASYNGAASNDKRALAMLIQADKVVIEDSALLGFQDTLELFTGRQIFKNCLISGSVDFIFGTNNTTYFYQCEIKVVANGSNGGYVTAFKGLNKGSATDKVTYGAVFDDCDFSAEAGVPVGKTAIGRAWGADAAVMVMNCRLGGHISKNASTNAGGRYVSMGNGDPKTAQFTEYNNTGDGAVTALTVGRVLTEAEAANYNKLEVIFGKVNGKVTYADVWDITV